MKDNWKSYAGIMLILGAFIAFNLIYKGPSDEDFTKAGISILTESNQQNLLYDIDTPVMILYKTNTCNVCKVFAPKFIDFAKRHQGKARFIVADPNNIDFDKFGVRAYPTTRLYFQGKVIEELIGNGSLTSFKKKIDDIK